MGQLGLDGLDIIYLYSPNIAHCIIEQYNRSINLRVNFIL